MSQIPQLLNGNRLSHDAVSDKQFISRSPETYVELFSDFIQDVGETINLPFVFDEAGSTNATGNFIDAPDGVYRLAHTADNETQAVALHLGGTNAISPTKEVIFEARVKITLATDAAFDTSSLYEVIVGLASAGSAASVSAAAFDGFADSVNFRLGGGAQTTNSIFLESDDGGVTADNDDKDSGIDFTSGTYHVYKIDMTDTSDVKFYVDGVSANNGNTFDMKGIAATDYLEPFIMMARTDDGGTERAHTMDIDYVKCIWKRT